MLAIVRLPPTYKQKLSEQVFRLIPTSDEKGEL